MLADQEEDMDGTRTEVERLRAILEADHWPTGVPLTIAERRVIAHNIELAEAKARHD